MYYSKEFIKNLSLKIGMSEDKLNAVLSGFPYMPQKDGEEKAKFLADSGISMEEKKAFILELCSKEKGTCSLLSLYMAAGGYLYEKYKEKGISDEIFYDTLNCIPEKMTLCADGEYSYYAPLWPLGHINMQTFRIGRLTYAVTESYPKGGKLPQDTFCEAHTPFIAVHISDGEKLVRCAESIEEARSFFKKFYPEIDFTCFSLTTWLIDPDLTALLPKKSNICELASLFNIYARYDDKKEVLTRIFGEYNEDLSSYSPTTSLAKTVLNALKNGKALGRGCGYIPF